MRRNVIVLLFVALIAGMGLINFAEAAPGSSASHACPEIRCRPPKCKSGVWPWEWQGLLCPAGTNGCPADCCGCKCVSWWQSNSRGC